MKESLDLILVDRRLVESRNKAQWLIRNGFVLVEGKKVKEPGTRIDNRDQIELLKEYPYVGRGGLKLKEALKAFGIQVQDKICADIGASVGGFTDCLLQNGAKRVYAIDTAISLLHPSLKCDKSADKVIPLLGIDARELNALEEDVDLCTIDITFASLKSVLRNVTAFLKNDGDIITLVKPLFESENNHVNETRIIIDREELKLILREFVKWSLSKDFYPHGLIQSPMKGRGGSIEFFFHLRIDERSETFDIQDELNELFG